MSRPLRASIVRIWNERQQVVGTGFLVGPQHVLTCAHVVAGALGGSGQETEPPAGEVRIDFPLLERPVLGMAATVARWWPIQPDGGGDVAGLVLEAPPPEGAEPVLLMGVEEPWGLAFRTFGFPGGRPGGDWSAGVLADTQSNGWLQIEAERQTGRRVQPGYSGAPVWIEATGAVGGMVVAADQGGTDRVAYVIPTEVLVRNWPEVLEGLAVPPTPYRGLNAFRAVDSELFFGRDELVGRLSTVVTQQPLTALVGPSGSGKSSIAHAGVVARLNRSANLRIVPIRPRQDPFGELAAGLLAELEPDMSTLDRIDQVPRLAEMLGHGRTVSVLRQLLHDGRDLLIIVDQFEELYTHVVDPAEQQRFVKELLRAADEALDGHVHVVVTLRADFLAEALGEPAFAKALSGAIEPVGPMFPDQLRQAIEGPARLRGVRFEPGLVDRILGDVGDQPGRLPLLEFTLTLLWDDQNQRRLTHAAYTAFGGVTGALTHYAEQVYTRSSLEEQERMRRIFVQLVSPGDGTADTRKLALWDAFGPGDWTVARRLADRRLVVTGTGVNGEQTIEIAHEALIQEWARLREWVAEDREFRLWQERVRNAIRLWRSFQGDEAVLLRGALLVEAQTWLDQRPEDIMADEHAFVDASRERQEREDQQYQRLYQDALARQLVAQAELVRSSRPNSVPLSVLLGIESLRRVASFEADYVLRRGLSLIPSHTKLFEHDADVHVVVFSPDGTKLLTAGDDATARVWDTTSGNLLLTLRHGSYIRVAVFSPKGDLIATGGEDEKARLWSIDGRELAVMPHDGWVGALTFHPDGTMLATGCDDGVIRLYDGGSEPRARVGHDGWVRSLCFHPSGELLLSASGDQTARLWQSGTWTERARLTHDAAVRAAVFDRTGDRVATGDNQGFATVWTPETGDRLRLPHDGAVTAVAFDRTGSLLATASEDGSGRLWQARTGALVLRLPHGGPVRAVSFDVDDSRLGTASDDGTGRVWNARRGVELVRMCHERAVRAIAFSPDGTRAATASEDAHGALWTAAAHAERVRLPSANTITALAVDARGGLLAVADEDHALAIWSPAGTVPASLVGMDEPAVALAFAPGSTLLAAGGAAGTVRVWTTADWRSTFTVGLAEQVQVVTFSPDGALLAAGGSEGMVRVWGTADGVLLHEFALGQYVSAVMFGSDSASLAVAGDEDTVCVWSLPDDVLTARHVYEHEWLGVAALDPALRYVASVGEQGRVQVLDLTTGQPAADFSHESWVSAAVFAHGGRWVATAGEDGTARVWNVVDGAEVARLPHDEPVTHVAFTDDDGMLVTGARDGHTRLWLLRTEDLIDQACARLVRRLTPEQWRRHLGDEPYVDTCGQPEELRRV